MDINIKDTLKKLRQDKGTTQEQLAAHLGISPQAISKWERGEGLPDITLLPAIALYFGITIDELLDVGREKIAQKIKSYEAESMKLKNAGRVEDDYELWEMAYKELPSEEAVICGRMRALSLMFNRVSEEEKKKLVSDNIVEMGEQLLKSSNSHRRDCAIQELTYHYRDLGNIEMAKKYANMGGNYYVSQKNLLSHILEGEEGVKIRQNIIMELSDIIAADAFTMTRKASYSHEERAEICRFCIDIYRLVYKDGYYGFFASRMSRYYSFLALEYAAMEDAENCLNALEEGAKFAVLDDTQPDGFYTSIIVNRMEHRRESTSKTYTWNTCCMALSYLDNKRYDFIRDTDRFKTVTEKLREYAKWENE